jgi:threonine dehydratase
MAYINKVKSVYDRISKYIVRTPLQYNEGLSTRYNANIYLKREDTQVVRSFKNRGALNKILLSESNEIVCASAGNHAQGVAYSCNTLGYSGDIFLPTITPLQKISRIEHFSNNSCKLHLIGNNFDETLEHALEYANKHNKTFVHPYNDTDVIDGQATIAHEIIEQLKEINVGSPQFIMTAIGGGGLISGTGQYFQEALPDTRIIGVEPEFCASMQTALRAGKLVTIENIDDNFVDGASVKRVGEVTFDICKNTLHLDPNNILTVPNGRICEEIIRLHQYDGIVVEPAGALPIASLDQLLQFSANTSHTSHTSPQQQPIIVCIVSGGNNDITRYPEFMEKSMKFQNRRHYYLVRFNQRPGELKRFINNVIGGTDDIIRFEYNKKTNKNYEDVLMGIDFIQEEDTYTFNLKLDKLGFQYHKVNESEANGNNQLYNFLLD